MKLLHENAAVWPEIKQLPFYFYCSSGVENRRAPHLACFSRFAGFSRCTSSTLTWIWAPFCSVTRWPNLPCEGFRVARFSDRLHDFWAVVLPFETIFPIKIRKLSSGIGLVINIPIKCLSWGIYLYTISMKRRELHKKLIQCGWHLHRQGSSHEVWTNGEHIITVPRHKEIREITARMILRAATMNRGSRKWIFWRYHVCEIWREHF